MTERETTAFNASVEAALKHVTIRHEAAEADTFAVLDGEFPASLDLYDVLA